MENLRVQRGATAILDGVDWRVALGENWVILGANGAGKTSLLRALTGYLPPTSGVIQLLGRTYGRSDWRDLRGRIGIVTSAFAAAIPPGEPALETVMSGRFAQLDLWAATSRRDRADAAALLEGAGLGRLVARPWAFLSQGERQRVLIARALMGRPEILILDEPCAGLDPVARDSFLGFVDRVARAGAPALVLVTHHVEEITPGFSHVLLLQDGRSLAAGPRKETMNSRNLSAAFGARMRLTARGGRFAIVTIAPR